jgi:hypothetical protein
MTAFSIEGMKDFDVFKDGRKMVLNFSDENDKPVSVKVTTMAIEKIMHELTFALTKAYEMSDISKQGIVPFLRPQKSRASLVERWDGCCRLISASIWSRGSLRACTQSCRCPSRPIQSD